MGDAQSLLPSDKEAEQGVLGACIHDNGNLTRLAGVLDPIHFFSPFHRDLYKAMRAMAKDSWPVDEITLRYVLEYQGKLDQVGGVAYINELQDLTPVAANVMAYAEIVLQKWKLRRIIQVCEETAAAVRKNPSQQQLITAIEGLRDEPVKILAMGLNMDGVRQGDAVKAFLDRIEHPPEDAAQPVHTFTKLDDFLKRASVSRPVVIAARPGVGKTAFGMGHIARNMAFNGVPGLRFNMEMDLDEIVSRDVAAESGVDSLELVNPQQDILQQDKWQKISDAEARMEKYPLWTYTPGSVPLTIPRMEAIGRHHINKYGVRFIVIDQLDKIAVNVKGADYDRQTARMVGVTALVKRLRVPIYLLCQVGRSGEEKLTLSALKSTGQIEQDAHAVVFIQEIEPVKGSKDEADWNDYRRLSIFIAKNGGGPTGTFTMGFFPRLSKFQYPA